MPCSGDILINGINIKNIDIRQWQHAITPIFQDFGKYYFTILENIVMGTEENINEFKINRILNEVGLDSFVSQSEKKWDTPLGKMFDGIELSGGQWQKLAIARAIYKNSPIIILDEPTASLDPFSENEIYNKLSDLSRDKTVIFVTHRLSSVIMADRIFFLEDGEVSHIGSHSDLLQHSDNYRKMYEIQANRYSQLKTQWRRNMAYNFS